MSHIPWHYPPPCCPHVHEILDDFVLQSFGSAGALEELQRPFNAHRVEMLRGTGAKSMAQTISGCVASWLRILYGLQAASIQVAIGEDNVFLRRHDACKYTAMTSQRALTGFSEQRLGRLRLHYYYYYNIHSQSSISGGLLTPASTKQKYVPWLSTVKLDGCHLAVLGLGNKQRKLRLPRHRDPAMHHATPALP